MTAPHERSPNGCRSTPPPRLQLPTPPRPRWAAEVPFSQKAARRNPDRSAAKSVYTAVGFQIVGHGPRLASPSGGAPAVAKQLTTFFDFASDRRASCRSSLPRSSPPPSRAASGALAQSASRLRQVGSVEAVRRIIARLGTFSRPSSASRRASVSLFVPPHHAMYLDEPWYAEAACNLARSGQAAALRGDVVRHGPAMPYEKALGMADLHLTVDDAGRLRHLGRASISTACLGSATVLLVALAALCAGAAGGRALIARGTARDPPRSRRMVGDRRNERGRGDHAC